MIDTLLVYPLRDWNEFKVEYKEKIRISMVWDKLVGTSVGFKIADKDTIFHLVKYESGDWRDGKPISLKHSSNSSFSFVRVPAIKISENEFLLLDGNHRIQEMTPQFCVIDFLEITKEKRKYITDLYNPFYD